MKKFLLVTWMSALFQEAVIPEEKFLKTIISSFVNACVVKKKWTNWIQPVKMRVWTKMIKPCLFLITRTVTRSHQYNLLPSLFNSFETSLYTFPLISMAKLKFTGLLRASSIALSTSSLLMKGVACKEIIHIYQQ